MKVHPPRLNTFETVTTLPTTGTTLGLPCTVTVTPSTGLAETRAILLGPVPIRLTTRLTVRPGSWGAAGLGRKPLVRLLVLRENGLPGAV